MRLRLTLVAAKREGSFTLNYAYYLSSAIYSWIEQSSPEYSAFLHQKGYSPEGLHRRFKHFCFSQLVVPDRRIDGGRLHFRSPEMIWYVGMPVDATVQHLVTGMFEKRGFFIEREDNRFLIEQIEVLPEPEWKSSMTFRLLSPVTVSVPEQRNGRLVPRYLRVNDPLLSEALRTNIVNKYRSLYGENGPEGAQPFQCAFDQHFIASRGGPERVSKLITIKEGRTDETKVRGFLCPVNIEGDIDLIKLAYDSGLGEKNSMGFGMIEAVSVGTSETTSDKGTAKP